MVTAVLFIVFFLLLILDVPIAICLGASSVAAILTAGQSLTVVATNTYTGISKTLLLAIPFFILAGNIMAKAGISKRLIKFIDSCVGHRRGGIAIVCVIVACFFGAISGSGPATVAALGAILIPAMVEAGFSAAFAMALMAAASSIAIVIPPSIAYVVYASITGENVGDLFIAGIIPGILMGLALIVVVMIEVRKKGIQSSREKADWKERWVTFKDAFWGFLMPVIILGGIYGGVFTPTEAAAVAAVYGLVVGVFIYREIKWRELIDITIESAKTTGGIMLIVASATLFSYVCTLFGISNAATTLLGNVSANKFVFLLICNVIFLIAGCFIDANSAMYIFIPIMFPICKALGFSPIAFGIMATLNLAIGQVTPPVGVNLFVAISLKVKNVAKVTLQQISKAVMPMVAAALVVLVVFTYFPRAAYTTGTSSTTDVAADSTKIQAYDNETYDPSEDAFYNDAEWEEVTWHYACSTGETSTWAKAGRYFAALMEESTGGKVKVIVDGFSDQLTNGSQKDGIGALMEGDPVQLSMHSNLIYSGFDDRFNVVSLPYIFDDYDDVDAKLDGEAGAQLEKILEDMGLKCFGMAENGFRQLTNSKREVKTVDDLKGLKVRVAGSNLLMKSYENWQANATNMNWSETYTALQQNTVEGQENPLPAIASASVQEVQDYISLWNAYYDCLFFCMNGDIYNSLTDAQKEVIDANAKKTVEYQRAINRYECDLLIEEWKANDVITVTETADIDTEGFKNATSDVAEWFIDQLVNTDGYLWEEAEALVNAFTAEALDVEAYDNEQYDASKDAAAATTDWEEMTWHYACSTGETSTWAKAGRYFAALMEESTGGKVKVVVDGFSDQLTNGSQKDGIGALMEGDPVQLSMHSNLIYSGFDDRFNVVSLPYIFDDYNDVDAKLDGEAGEQLVGILEGMGLKCFGMAENGFRQLTNSKREVKTVDDLKGLKVRVAGSNLLMKSYEDWQANATNMNWSETYTALQQNTVEGQENPLPAIASASVQEVQDYISLWNAYYDCLFFCMNGEIFDSLTPEQQAIVEENAKKTVEYQRMINRFECDQLIADWEANGTIEVVHTEDIDTEGFKNATAGVADWFVDQLVNTDGFDEAEAKSLVEAFTK
ncbi:MAG: TRAP transporter large permease subunit [bacterium]|nr:TRAP transporter large permease subunit [bacterium]MDY4100434.1 TRAP transporter large permease subunit [Lachnospiraceae bacterium]